jgi:hypothetical protein
MTPSPAYREYQALLGRLRALTDTAESDGELAERLRSAMDDLWAALTPSEAEWFRAHPPGARSTP